MRKLFKQILLVALCGIGMSQLAGKVVLPGIFSDHAVLTRSKSTAIFGKADPGEIVTVTLDKQVVSATADQSGKWLVHLDLSQCGNGPFELKINDIVIKDVLLGSVWVCSGQSNMAFLMNKTENFNKVRVGCANNYIRQFQVRNLSKTEPYFNKGGKWVIAAPETLASFTGVGYYFARKLNAELKMPIGLIKSAWGGSPIEAWIPSESLKDFPKVAKRDKLTLAAFEKYPGKVKKYLQDEENWIKKNKRDLPVVMPKKDTAWVSTKANGFSSGIVWLRRNIDIAPENAGKPLKVALPRQSTAFLFFVNGQQVYEHKSEAVVKNLYVNFTIPGKLLKAGQNELLFRYFSPNGRNIRFLQPLRFGKIFYDDVEWDMYQEIKFKKLPGFPKHPGRPPRDFFNGSRLFNGCIYSLLPYTVTGTIWYQGETNAPRASEYADLQKALIESWRKAFNNPDMPFYVCSLAGFKSKTGNPAAKKENYADLRDAQIKGLTEKNSGIAILTDVGEARDIHPIDKRTPGERLAAIALANVFGKKVIFAGPKALAAEREGSTVTVTYEKDDLHAAAVPAKHAVKKRTNLYADLKRNSPDAQLEGFALCGADGKWFWADKAEISGKSVKVSSKKVAVPVKIRYNWSDNPSGNLYNRAGFPAEPFEMDVK